MGHAVEISTLTIIASLANVMTSTSGFGWQSGVLNMRVSVIDRFAWQLLVLCVVDVRLSVKVWGIWMV